MKHPGVLITAHQPEVLLCHMDLQREYLMDAYARRQRASIRHRLEVETWLACTSSRELDNKLCCFFSDVISDVKPKPFDHRNLYQQFKIHRHHRHSFFAKSTATDSIPPKFLRKNGWELRISWSYRLQLNEALGLDSSLRTRLPDFNFPMYSKKSPSVVVGQWYCPFIFVREECRLR
ncbi:hypothetical protein CRYUN_Cryun26dG0108400 [Craigia yunnanensis]